MSPSPIIPIMFIDWKRKGKWKRMISFIFIFSLYTSKSDTYRRFSVPLFINIHFIKRMINEISFINVQEIALTSLRSKWREINQQNCILLLYVSSNGSKMIYIFFFRKIQKTKYKISFKNDVIKATTFISIIHHY